MPLNHFGAIGLGTRKYQPDNEPVKTCSEKLKPGCGCCRIGPCDICLEWEPYGESIEYGTAVDSGDEWVGSAGGIVFVAAWDSYTCTFSITLNGTEVFSAVLCGDSGEDTVTCRNWDGEVPYTNGYEDGTFRWAKKTHVELQKRKGDPDGEYKCARPFCGDCTCTCDQLCVTVTDTGGLDSCTGIIPHVGYMCDDRTSEPEWEGSIDCDPSGSLLISVQLVRDDYDNCILTGSVSGTVGEEPLDAEFSGIVVSNCASMSATFEVEDGGNTYSVSIRCLDCGSCEPEICLECCDSVPPSPPATLTCRISLGAIEQPEDPEPPFSTACWTNLEFPISFIYDVDEDVGQVCVDAGTTRRVDCIGNLLDGEFNESCCSGGQWVGGGSNACGDIDVCFVPCGELSCGTPPPGETLTSWDLYVQVGGTNCSEGRMCLICHDAIAWSVEGFAVCGEQLFTTGTGSALLVIDITES
jgi:hypothetical protein